MPAVDNGIEIEGNLFDDENLVSFVGQFDIPPRHGMTIGELARYYASTIASSCSRISRASSR